MESPDLNQCRNRPLSSSLVPLFQCESKCQTILMKMNLIWMKMKLHAELIFIWKVSHLDSFWNRGARELGNGLFMAPLHTCIPVAFSVWYEREVRAAIPQAASSAGVGRRAKPALLAARGFAYTLARSPRLTCVAFFFAFFPADFRAKKRLLAA